MNSDDGIFFGVMSVVASLVLGLLIVLGIVVYQASTGANQATVDITGAFALPDELAGCRVYRMTPAGFGRSLYVISRDGQPKGVAWETHDGKDNTQRHDVLLEVE